MRTPLDLAGQRFGRLVAVSKHPVSAKNKKIRWVCTCDCGTESVVIGNDLKRGHAQSCGCLKRERILKSITTHGHSKRNEVTKEYSAYHHMLARCFNPKIREYKHYGGRGITVCDRWLKSFDNFVKDMGPVPPGYTLERKDNNGNYDPANCVWATRKQQAQNMRTNRWIEFNGEKKVLSEWARLLGISQGTLWDRLNNQWPIERALGGIAGSNQ